MGPDGEPIDPASALPMLFAALCALGMAVTLVNLRDFIPMRLRSSSYVGVAVLFMAMAVFLIREGPGPGALAGLFIAFLSLVILAQQLGYWRVEAEERKREKTQHHGARRQ
jgi:hypothetical protein